MFPTNKSTRALLLAAICSLPLTTSLHAVESDPVLSDNPFVTEGYAQLEAGKPQVALEAFQKALDANANDLSALLGRAMIYADQLQYEKAFESYDAITRNFPRHAFAWNGRGLAAFNLEDFDEALTSFEQATADQPVNGFFYESLAWAQMCRGEFGDAAQSAKTATLMYDRKGETSVYPLLIAYFAYLETGDSENAQRTLEYAEKNRPLNQWPSPVIDYLAGKIDQDELISFVMDTSQETEAHAYIGLKLRSENQLAEAARQLDWVGKHGNPRVFEYTLARVLNLRSSVAALVQ